MALRNRLGKLLEREVLIRLDEEGNALICTSRWSMFSRTRRIAVGLVDRALAPQAGEAVPVRREQT